MYIEKFHQRYAKCVRTFCESVPSVLQVTTEEIDTYFRSCALHLWAYSAGPGGYFAKINQLYTDSKVKFTHQEFEDQINFYRTNLAETVSVPDFFLRMLAFDIDSGTDSSRRFTEVQDEILAICAEGILLLSSLDCRRIAWMNERLVIICDQAEIGENGSRGEKEPIDAEMAAFQKEIEEITAEIRAEMQQALEVDGQIQENDEGEGADLKTGEEC